MFEGWKGKIIFTIEVIIIVLVFGTLFNHIIHPLLADIHPIFAPQNAPIEERSIRGPDSPAEAMGYLIGAIFFFMYFRIKRRILNPISNKKY